jgi:hypothetical protein
MIHDLEMGIVILWVLLPYIIVVSIVMVTIFMLIKWIPIWIKQWKDLDNDDWWK